MSREAGADRGGQPLDFGGKPYRSLDYECKRIFGQKLYKISLNGGMTCPQPGRDAGHAGLYFLQRRRERGLRPRPRACPLRNRSMAGKQVFRDRNLGGRPVKGQVCRSEVYRLFPILYEYLCAGALPGIGLLAGHPPPGYCVPVGGEPGRTASRPVCWPCWKSCRRRSQCGWSLACRRSTSGRRVSSAGGYALPVFEAGALGAAGARDPGDRPRHPGASGGDQGGYAWRRCAICQTGGSTASSSSSCTC